MMNVDYGNTDNVLLRACASLPASLLDLPKADTLRRIADRKFGRKDRVLMTKIAKYPEKYQKVRHYNTSLKCPKQIEGIFL